MAKQCGALENKNLEYYNAWSTSESSRAALFSDYRELANEKYALQQQLENERKGNGDLSATLMQSNVALQGDVQQLQQRIAVLDGQVQNFTNEKDKLEQALKKALKGNDELSSIIQDYEARSGYPTERLSQTQKEDANSENTPVTLLTSESVSPLILDQSEDLGERRVKRRKRGVRNTSS